MKQCIAASAFTLMLAAGTFTGFVESFVRLKGVVYFSAWTKRIGG